MARTARTVTVATMIACGSDIPTTLGVYRATLRTARNGQQFWNLNASTTRQVGTFTIERGSGSHVPYLLPVAEQFATAEAPAFAF